MGTGKEGQWWNKKITGEEGQQWNEEREKGLKVNAGTKKKTKEEGQRWNN